MFVCFVLFCEEKKCFAVVVISVLAFEWISDSIQVFVGESIGVALTSPSIKYELARIEPFVQKMMRDIRAK